MSDLPASWCLARLDELVAERSAITDGPFGSNLKTSHYTDSGPRVVRLQNIGDGVFIDARAHISEDRYRRLERHWVVEGDVLVASLGEELPRACVAPRALGPAIVKADCIRTRPAPGIDGRYVMYALNSPSVRDEVAGRIQGVGRPRINLSTVRAIQLPLAPPGEQLRIVDELERRLSHVDAAVAGLHRAARRLVAVRDAVMWSVVVPGGREGDLPGLPVLPAGWRWSRLGDVASVAGGVTKDSKRQYDPEFVEVPYLRVANVQRGYLDLDEVRTIRVPKGKAVSLRLQHGDVLFNEGGDRDKLGRGWVWEGQIEDCIHQNHVFRARVHEPALDPKFVSWFGNTFGRRWFEAVGKQTTNLASLNATNLKAFPIPVPPTGVAQSLVAEGERRLSLVETAEQAIATSLSKAGLLRRSLLAAAFTGRLVAQDVDDEPVSELLARIRANREGLGPGTNSSRMRKGVVA